MRKSFLLFSVLFLLFNSVLKGQNTAPPLPQRSVSLSLDMPLNFGDIAILDNNDGTVHVGSDGIPLHSSNVEILTLWDSPHRAELSFQLCPGRLVNIKWTPSFTMTSSSGTQIDVDIDDVTVNTTSIQNDHPFLSNKGCSETHHLYIGGTLKLLSVGGYAGSYYGEFLVSINYQ